MTRPVTASPPCRPLGLAATLASTLLLTAGPSWGSEAEGEAAEEPNGHHHVVGLKGSYLAGFSHGEVHHLGGGGVFLETSVIHHWLELELGVRGLANAHDLAFPIDVLLKLPFYASDAVHPFIGAGPTIVLGFEEGVGTSFHAGGAFTVGSYFWPWSWGGFVVEGNYNLISHDGLVHEVGPNLGFAYRW